MKGTKLSFREKVIIKLALLILSILTASDWGVKEQVQKQVEDIKKTLDEI